MRTFYLLMLAAVAACSGGGREFDPYAVTVHVPDAPRAIVAYRDGDGPWSIATEKPTFSFLANSGSYTVAIGCIYQYERHVAVYAATPGELPTIEYQRECGVEGMKVSGRVGGFGSAQGAYVFVGSRGGMRVFPDNLTYTLAAPRGVRDLVAMRYTIFGADRIFIRRGITVDASPIMLDIDFGGSDAVEVVTSAITWSDTEQRPSVSSWLWTQRGTWTDPALHDLGSFAFGVPSSVLEPGDLHVIQVDEDAPGTAVWRSITWAVRDLTDRTFSLPTPSDAQATASAVKQGSSVAVTFDWPSAPDAPLYRFRAAQGYVISEALVTRDAFQGPTYVMPDLTGVAGWDPNLALSPDIAVEWRASAETGSTVAQMTLMVPTQEATIVHNGWRGQVTPQ